VEAGEEGFSDAEEVDVVGAGKEVLAVFLGLVGVDADDEIALVTESGGEVGDVGGFVFAAEIDAVFGNLAAAGGGGDLLDEVSDSGSVVLDGEGGLEDVAAAVADQGDVLGLDVVEGDAKDLAGAARALEDGADGDVLIAIDRLKGSVLADSHLQAVSLCDDPLLAVGWNPVGVRNQLFPTQGSPDPGNPGLWDETPMA